MKISIVGGTGDVGSGLALRWSKYYDIVIGSRQESKAIDFSSDLMKKAKNNYGNSMKGNIRGAENSESVKGADAVVLTIPHTTLEPIITSIKGSIHKGQLVISPVVPMEKVGPTFRYRPYQDSGELKSAAETIVAMLPEGIETASAFHTVPAGKLQNIDEPIDADVVISSHTRDVFDKVAQLVTSIPNLRPLYGGGLEMSAQIESITPLLLNLHLNSRAFGKVMTDPSVKFV